MKYKVKLTMQNNSQISLELDDENSPKTVHEFVERLPFKVTLNVWGDEIYTSESPINQPEENALSVVDLYDVAYWPSGKAICLFYGHTPIGDGDAITPASPVNVLGKILNPDKTILTDADGSNATFSLIT